jgi:hypothetical protein
MKTVLIFCFLTVVLFAKSVTVTGIAPFVTSKIDTKKQAILDAKIKAVETAIGVYIKSQTQMENYEIKYDIVEQNIKGFVSDYVIVSEKNSDGIYTVTIKADVKNKTIHNEIENLVSVLHYNKKPKFMILTKGDSMVASIFKSSLKSYFLKNKIDIIDQNAIGSSYLDIINKQSTNSLIPYKRLGVDYLVSLDISKQTLDTQYKGEKYKSVNLHITADIINTSTFDTLVTKIFPSKASDNRIIVQSDIVNAANNISKTFSKELLIDIVDKLKENMYNGEKVKLIIKGLPSYQAMQEFKDYLQEIVPSISNIYSKNYSKQNTIFELTIKGGITKFLDDFILNNENYNIEIKNKDSNKCILEVKNNL